MKFCCLIGGLFFSYCIPSNLSSIVSDTASNKVQVMIKINCLVFLSNSGLVSAFCVQLYASTDLGRKWTLLQERVTKDRIFWSVTLYSLNIGKNKNPVLSFNLRL